MEAMCGHEERPSLYKGVLHTPGDVCHVGLPNTPWGFQTQAGLLPVSYPATTEDDWTIYNRLIARFNKGMWPCIEVWPFAYERTERDGSITTVRSNVRIELAANTPVNTVKALYDREQMVPKGAVDPYVTIVEFTREPGAKPRKV